MAETEAMPALPKMSAMNGGKPVEMTTSDAMDLLDKHGITEADYDQVMAAIEMVYGEEQENPQEQMAETPTGDDQAMLDQMFASGRKR